MKNVKVLLSALLALAMLLGMTGAMAEGFSVDTLEVKIWDNNQLAGLQKIADLWTEKTGVKVNIQVVDWGNYWTLLEAGASGGDMPDVFWMHSNNAQMYMAAHKLLDLTDYIAQSDVVNLENYYEGVTALYTLDGRNYAVAKDHDTIALLYNKALLGIVYSPFCQRKGPSLKIVSFTVFFYRFGAVSVLTWPRCPCHRIRMLSLHL